MTDKFTPDILFVGDLHIDEREEWGVNEEGINLRLLDGIDILRQIADLVKELSLKWVIFTGDIFEKKDRIPAHVLVRFSDEISRIQLNGAQIIMVKGNHDFKFPKYSTASVMVREGFISEPSTFHIVSTITRKVGVLPYIRDYEQFKTEWNKLHTNNPDLDIIVFHQELPGVYYSSGKVSLLKWDFPVLKDALYIGGHIHNAQNLLVDNNVIHFIGTPYQFDFDNHKGSRTVMLYSSVDGKIETKSLNYPRFVDFDVNSEKPMIIAKNKYVRLVGIIDKSKKDKVQYLKDTFLSIGAKGVKVNVKYLSDIVRRSTISEKMDRISIVKQFVESFVTEMDKDELTKEGIRLMEGVK